MVSVEPCAAVAIDWSVIIATPSQSMTNSSWLLPLASVFFFSYTGRINSSIGWVAWPRMDG